jgi:alkanesulfonate monooxygenase SsuD/methylene tetrahydromethanopterin reductase-like flavin-dependent oxidoreductase (luciferase family)
MIDVGLQYLGGAVNPKRFARAAENAGFDSVWCGDHVGHYVDGLSTLGCFAGCTEDITIGSNVLVAPLRPAVATAKAIATVASIAGPRLIAGIGIGGDIPAEFEAVGADRRHRGAITDEFLTVLAPLLDGDPVSFRGRWTTLDAFRITPPAPTTRIWIGGRSEAALKRAVRFGDGYLGYLLSPEGLAKRAARLDVLAGDSGRSRPRIACNLFVFPAASIEAGLAAVNASELDLAGLTPEFIRGAFVLGTEQECLDRIERYVDAGVEHVILGVPPGDEQQFANHLAFLAGLLPDVRNLDRHRQAAP